MYQIFKTEALLAGARASLFGNESWMLIKKGEQQRIITMEGDWVAKARAALAEIA